MITRGKGTLFSLNGQSFNFTGSLSYQDSEYTKKSDIEEIRDSNGEEVTWNFYNVKFDGTFTGVLTGTSGSVSITSYAPGSLFTFTDTNDTMGAATNWVLEEVSPKRSNTTSARIQFKLRRSDNITT